jgi:hypothetical protein
MERILMQLCYLGAFLYTFFKFDREEHSLLLEE